MTVVDNVIHCGHYGCRVSEELDVPLDSFIPSACQRTSVSPHRRPSELPGYGHQPPQVWPRNSPPSYPGHLVRGFTPFPLVAS